MNQHYISLMTQFVRLLRAGASPEQQMEAARMIQMHLDARDLKVAKAVRDAILERNRLGWEKFPALNLIEIIKGVK